MTTTRTLTEADRALCGEHGAPLSTTFGLKPFVATCEHGCCLWGSDIQTEPGTHLRVTFLGGIYVVED